MSLADIYWFNEDTGQAQKPHARTHGDHGDQMNSTLCPAHLHIYHTLKCMVEEQEMAQEGFGKAAAKGTSIFACWLDRKDTEKPFNTRVANEARAIF